jgi:hypothetical protein
MSRVQGIVKLGVCSLLLSALVGCGDSGVTPDTPSGTDSGAGGGPATGHTVEPGVRGIVVGGRLDGGPSTQQTAAAGTVASADAGTQPDSTPNADAAAEAAPPPSRNEVIPGAADRPDAAGKPDVVAPSQQPAICASGYECTIDFDFSRAGIEPIARNTCDGPEGHCNCHSFTSGEIPQGVTSVRGLWHCLGLRDSGANATAVPSTKNICGTGFACTIKIDSSQEDKQLVRSTCDGAEGHCHCNPDLGTKLTDGITSIPGTWSCIETTSKNGTSVWIDDSTNGTSPNASDPTASTACPWRTPSTGSFCPATLEGQFCYPCACIEGSWHCANEDGP